MARELLKKILEDKLDSAVSIAFANNNEPHMVNTWISYIILEDDELWIPASGMKKAEEFLKNNDTVVVSICNREILGSIYAGCGVLIKGKAKMLNSGKAYDAIKKDFDWARAALVIHMEDIKQAL